MNVLTDAFDVVILSRWLRLLPAPSLSNRRSPLPACAQPSATQGVFLLPPTVENT